MKYWFPSLFTTYPIRDAFLAIVLLSSSTAVSAQHLAGKVKDPSNNDDLIGATVTVSGKSISVSNITELDGSFRFKNLPVGPYKVTVSYIGYKPFEEQVEIPRSGERWINVHLNSEAQNLTELVIAGAADRESDESARKSELKAANILNIVSAKAIEISPDISLGNVLQRVSGVSMLRSGSGDGQFAIIRGLPNRYTYSSINGIILPSPDPQTRAIPLDMFPANLMERVEIIKSLTPNVEGNAIGGATNLVMKEAPNSWQVNGSIATGANTIFSGRAFSGFDRSGFSLQSPSEKHGNGYQAKVSDFPTSQLRFNQTKLPLNLVSNLSIGNRILGKKLGFLLGGTYIREYRGSNSLLYTGQSIITNNTQETIANSSQFTTVQNRQYSYLQSRLGLQGKLDYQIDDQNSIKLSGIFLRLDEKQHRNMVQTGLSQADEIDYFDRVVFTRKTIANAAVSGYHKFSPSVSADWTGSYAVATSTRPNWTELSTFRKNRYSDTLYVGNPLNFQWLRSSDKDKSVYANIRYIPDKRVDITVGGMIRWKDRFSYYNRYNLNTVLAGLGVQQYLSAQQLQLSFSPAQNAFADSTNANNYSGTETVGGLYAMGKFYLGSRVELLAGVRQEVTRQQYDSRISDVLDAKTGSYKYADLLPSANLKYKLTDRQNIRASYFAGISRPNIYELVPTLINGDLYYESGNPNLKHTRSQNVDVRYENFFSTTNYVIIGAFYKNLINPIETSFGSATSTAKVTLQPTNPDKPAKDYGLELLFSKFLGNFGVSGNYTYIQSSVTTPKLIQQLDKAGNTVGVLKDQRRPLQGQSSHIANLSLLYKSARNGWNVQATYVYTGKRISVVSLYYGLDQWQRANSQLDLSVNKSFIGGITAFVKATNLLGANIYQDILASNSAEQNTSGASGASSRMLVQKDVFKQSVLAGVRLSL